MDTRLDSTIRNRSTVSPPAGFPALRQCSCRSRRSLFSFPRLARWERDQPRGYRLRSVVYVSLPAAANSGPISSSNWRLPSLPVRIWSNTRRPILPPEHVFHRFIKAYPTPRGGRYSPSRTKCSSDKDVIALPFKNNSIQCVPIVHLATKRPHAEKSHKGEWRISAGYRGQHFVAETGENSRHFPEICT